MIIRVLAHRVAPAAFAFAFALDLHAQEPRRLAQPDSVPYEAAAALVGASSFGAEPQLMIGGMPDWAKERLYVPSNGRVLGSSYIGNSMTTVIALPLASDSETMAAVHAEFTHRGWTAPPPPYFGGNGGFRPAVFSGAARQSPTRVSLCSGEYTLTADVRRHAGTALYLTYHLLNASSSACHPPTRPIPTYTSPSFPTLYEPDVSDDGRGTTSCYPPLTGASGGTAARFRTSMPRDRVLEHFAKQLADSGWTRVGESVAPPVAGAWSRPDSTGTPRFLTITISSPVGVSDTQCQEAQMNVTRQTKP